MNTAQTHVIVDALDALPKDLDRELVAKAEAHLVSEAGQLGPRELRRLGSHLMEVINVSPDRARCSSDRHRRSRGAQWAEKLVREARR